MALQKEGEPHAQPEMAKRARKHDLHTRRGALLRDLRALLPTLREGHAGAIHPDKHRALHLPAYKSAARGMRV